MLKHALRSLLGSPGFAIAAAGTLAVGIAAPTALFSTVNAALLTPLPYAHYENLYTVRTYYPNGRFTIGLLSTEESEALERMTDAVQALALLRRSDGTLTADGESRQVAAYGVSEGFFELFGLPLALGQPFVHEDHARNAAPRVVLSDAFWKRAFGGRPDIVGATITLDGRPARVAGVARPDFDEPAGTDLWFNGYFMPHAAGHAFDGYLRLKPGSTPAALTGRMAAAMEELGRKYPDQDKDRAYRVRPLLEVTVGDLGPILVILFGATVLLLLLATSNVTNLMLARSSGRSREMAIRAALGAGRRRIAGQLLLESLLLSSAGGAMGVALAYSGIHLLLRMGGARLPRLASLRFDGTVVVFVAVAVILATLLVGIVPALRMADTDIGHVMNEAGRGVRGSRRTRRLLAAFVVAEVAVAVALVCGAARLVTSFNNLRHVDPGFDPRGRLVLDVMLPMPTYQGALRQNAWWQAVEARLRDAGASHVAMATSLPLQHEWDSTTFVDLASMPNVAPERRPNGRLRLVSADFFRAMGIRVLTGRAFTAQDDAKSMPVAMVNREFVRRFLGDADPLRERITSLRFRQVEGRLVPVEVPIVGVADDVKYASLTEAAEPVVYMPEAQAAQPRQSIVVTAVDGAPERLIPRFKAALAEIDPTVPVEVGSMPALVEGSLERQKLGAWLMSGFGIAALLLATIGVFGVIGYGVAQQAGEMAVRQALGATRGQVFRGVVAGGTRLAAAGVAIGLLLAWWMGHLIARYVYDVRPADPRVLAIGALSVTAIAVAATLLPARRASSPDLARTLRSG